MARRAFVVALVLIAIFGLVSAQAPTQSPTYGSALAPSNLPTTAESPGGDIGTLDEPTAAPLPEGDNEADEGGVGGPVSPDSWNTPPADGSEGEKSSASVVRLSLATTAFAIVAGFFC